MVRCVVGLPRGVRGLLIGRGGETIRSIQESHDARLQLEGDRNVLIIEGKSQRIVDATVAEVERVTGVEVVRAGDQLCELSFHVPAQVVGRIVGKKGATIKGLMSTHRCVIDLPRNADGAQPVVIAGPKKRCFAAKDEIQGLVNNGAQIPLTSETNERVDANDGLLDLSSNQPIAESLFFPDDPAATSLNRFLEWLNSATKSVEVCVFSITDNRIANVLVGLAKRGCVVRIITDDDQSKTAGSDVEQLAQSGCQVRMDNSPTHMHHKFAVLDGKVLLNGSFNWTRGASSNNENVMVSNDATFVKLFRQHFEQKWKEFA